MIRWRGLFFVLAIIVFAVAWPASTRLVMDRSLQRMFAKEDPVRVEFETLQAKFGVSDLVVFAYRDPKLWSPDGQGLSRLLRIRQRAEALPGIASAMDLSKVEQMLSTLTNPLSWAGTLSSTASSHPLLDESNSIAQQFKKLFEGQTHGAKSDLVAIACLLKKSDREPQLQSQTLKELKALAQELPREFGISQGLLVGQLVMVNEGFEAIELDGLRLGWFSTISLMLLILLGFRSLRWALIAIGVVQWSLVVTRGLLVYLDWDLTMVSSMLSSIVTVIGVATTMHWMLGYQAAMNNQQSPREALAQSMRRLWRPIFWACITDAIGFASLAFAKVGPVQDYGCMMALASLIVLVGIFWLIPFLALVPLAPSPWASLFGLGYELREVPGESVVRAGLRKILTASTRHRVTVVIASIVLLVAGVWGSSRLEVETDFIKNFQPDSSLVTAYQAIERDLGGAGVWDVIVPAPKSLTLDYLAQVSELQENLRGIVIDGSPPLQLSLVMSLADTDRIARTSPLLGRLSVEARLMGMKQVLGSFVNTLIVEEPNGQRSLRIMLRSREQCNAQQKLLLIRSVKATVEQSVESPHWQSMLESKDRAIVTGYYVLLTELVSSVLADQWRCFAIATIGIWIAMAIALRSAWLPLISILPNALPSMCILGYMGWISMPVNLGAAMIAAVSMGLSVDSTLHYLMRMKREVESGASPGTALEATQSETGLAMILSTLALVIGFSSLATSDFVPTIVFGITAALSMLGGLLGNLILIPAMLSIHTNAHANSAATQ